MAAGLSIKPGMIPLFREKLNETARRQISPEHLLPSLTLDATACANDLTLDVIESIAALSPFGQGNPPIQLCLPACALETAPLRMGAQQQHARMRIHANERRMEAVWFGCGQAPMPSGRFDLAVTPAINTYNGNRTVQLKVLDWRPSLV